MCVFGNDSDFWALVWIISSNNLVDDVLVFTDWINDSETTIIASTNYVSFHHDQSCNTDSLRHLPMKSFEVWFSLNLCLNLWLRLLYLGMRADWNFDCFLANLVQILIIWSLKLLRAYHNFINLDSLVILNTAFRALMLPLMLIVPSVVPLLGLLIFRGLILQVSLVFAWTSCWLLL